MFSSKEIKMFSPLAGYRTSPVPWVSLLQCFHSDWWADFDEHKVPAANTISVASYADAKSVQVDQF